MPRDHSIAAIAEQLQRMPDAVLAGLAAILHDLSRQEDGRWVLMFAHNLAIGAGLCAAYQIAHEQSFTYCEHWSSPEWFPGCGRSVP